MARYRVRIRNNDANLTRLLRSPQGDVYRHVDGIMRQTAHLGRRNIRVDSGFARGQVYHLVFPYATRMVGRAGSYAHYSAFLDIGTGIYGPTGKPITPKRAKVLVFVPKGGSVVVFAASVKGIKGDRWLRRAFEAACPYPVRDTI
ncbi:hypothetical protein ACIBEJ_00365 [Nonomuraea sp. NPDC050790]|uniref:hypothetical protein n=1 Tax=Nonomuraea sp. NPDC050790 TaxID=3364371 RepID=UPI0037A8014A